MKRLFIDTNIVIDLLAKREPFYIDAAKIFSQGDEGKLRIQVSGLTIANTNYILTKMTNADESREILSRFKTLIEVIGLSEKIISLALAFTFRSNYQAKKQFALI